MVEPVNSSVLLQLTRERLEVEYPGFSPYVHDHWLQFSQVAVPTQLTWERLEVEYPGFSPYVHNHWLQFSQVTVPTQLT